MLKSNPILSRLDMETVMVDSSRREWFESCINMLVQSPDFAQMVSPQASSEDDFWGNGDPDDWRQRYRPYVVKDNVLYIPVQGVLLNKFGFQFGSYATGYTYIQKAVERGMADPMVKGIAFMCDTPGGECAGCFELGDFLFAQRGDKPMRAFAADRAYSAGYLVASSVGPITMTRTGGVGSIGVVTMHVDYSDALAMAGVKVTFIQEGKYKTDGNPYQRLSARAKSRIQVRIAKLMDIFVTSVVRNRDGLTEQAVRDTEADCYSADEALAIGLADKVQVVEEALIAFTDECNSDDDDGDSLMNQKPESTFSQAQLDTAVATARAEGKAEGSREGATAERARITAIIGCDAGKKRPKAALQSALKSDMTAEAAAEFLAALDEEKPAAAAPAPVEVPKPAAAVGALFSAAMQTGNPEVGADSSAGSGPELSEDEKATQAILGSYRNAAGIRPAKAA